MSIDESDLAKGWDAGKRGKPLDFKQSELWIEGFALAKSKWQFSPDFARWISKIVVATQTPPVRDLKRTLADWLVNRDVENDGTALFFGRNLMMVLSGHGRREEALHVWLADVFGKDLP